MSQPSVASYFNTRKRQAVDSLKQTSAKKVLVLDQNVSNAEFKCPTKHLKGHIDEPKIIVVKDATKMAKKGVKTTHRVKKKEEITNQPDIKQFVNSICNEKTEIKEKEITKGVIDREAELKTPPGSPITIVNAMDKVKVTGKELNFNDMKQKLSRSSRLAELKASLNRFKEKDQKLKEVEKKNEKNEVQLNLKEFKKIELEVCLSPTKALSPQKQYLSPKKDTTARKNLLNLLSPTRNAVALPPSPCKSKEETLSESFTLPFKYRCLLEIFRSIDIACQIMFNRKEIITFRKLKSAVEEMLKRNLFEKHLAQIAKVYPQAFCFAQEKLRVFGMGAKENRWELVVKPTIEEEMMSSDILLERRRKLNRLLVEKVHEYHDEFLKSVGLNINKEKLKRWHPEFSLETVPEIECEKLPQPPQEDKLTTGKEVLEKARDLFKCNTRMEAALERLKAAQESKQVQVEKPTEDIKNPLLKGIPKALLEKVRQRQAAKALENMTRSSVKDKEVQIYKRLPEIARLTRNLFVSERKNVLPLEIVIEKLTNSCRTFITKTDLEDHLKALNKEMPQWLVFHEIRQSTFIKISKDMDLTIVISRLEAITKAKIES